MNEVKIKKINQVLADFFEKNKDVKRIPALDMMDCFVDAGIFKMDYARRGLPIRNGRNLTNWKSLLFSYLHYLDKVGEPFHFCLY